MCLTNVDLPLPDNPMTQKISPGFTSNETLETPITELYFSKASCFEIFLFWIASKASLSVLPKTFQTFSIFISQPTVSLDIRKFYMKNPAVKLPGLRFVLKL